MSNYYKKLIQKHISENGTDYVKLIDFLQTLYLYDFRVDDNSIYIQPSRMAEFYIYDMTEFASLTNQ